MNTYQDLFWYVWKENMPELATSIIKCAVGPYRYRGDPQDVVQEVMLAAYRKWYEYDKEASAFRTWVLMLTKQYLSNLYKTKSKTTGPGLGNRPVPRYSLVSLDGTQLSIPTNSPTPEEIIIASEDRVQIRTTVHELFLAHRSTRKGQILEAMAALIDEELKPTYRLIAKMIGCSHSTVAKELEEIREWLSKNN